MQISGSHPQRLRSKHSRQQSMLFQNCATCQSGTSQGQNMHSLVQRGIATPGNPTAGEFSQVICGKLIQKHL
jgi:hypothetical protein